MINPADRYAPADSLVGWYVPRDHMGKKSIEIHVAASGLSRICTFSTWQCIWLGLLLTFRHDFRRKGSWIPAITDEAVYPDLIRGIEVIRAGWNNWFGYDFLAGDEESEVFLKMFYRRHCTN